MYKVGDKLVCIEDYWYGITILAGDIYTITYISDNHKIFNAITINDSKYLSNQWKGWSFNIKHSKDKFITLSELRKIKLERLESTSLIDTEYE